MVAYAHHSDALTGDPAKHRVPESQPLRARVRQRTERVIPVLHIRFPLLEGRAPTQSPVRRIVIDIDDPANESESDILRPVAGFCSAVDTTK